MEQPSFHPDSQTSHEDVISQILEKIAQWTLVISIGLSPILFVPTSFLPLAQGKVMLVMTGVGLALFFYVLHLLREGQCTLRFPLVYLAFFALAVVTLVAALVSGDVRDGVFGDGLEVYTVAFVVFLAVVTAAIGILGRSRNAMLGLYGTLLSSAVVLAGYHVLKLFFGPERLSFGLFPGATDSPLGGWNDVALFFGLAVLLCILAAVQLPLTRVAKGLMWFVVLTALAMLMVINFYAVWFVLAVVSCVVLVYNLTQHRYQQAPLPLPSSHEDSLSVILLTTLVAMISLVFIIMGATLGGVMNELTSINYVEVRPSTTATLEIARAVYQDDVVLGIGPNKFVDAWRLYKDPAINETLFWTTDFRAGSSYVATSVIELGAAGLMAWLAFFGLLLFSSFRLLFSANQTDTFWRFVGISSLVATLYLWGMAVLYTPGAAVLLLAAACTGIFMVAYSKAVPVRSLAVSVMQNRNVGFVLVATSIMAIVGVVSGLYAVGKQTVGAYSFNKTLQSIQPGDTLNDLEARITALYNQTENDAFVRQIALYELAQLQALLSLTEPTEQEQQAFRSAVAGSISAAQAAVASDSTDAVNVSVLAQIYALLSSIAVEGAYDRAVETIEEARRLDPKNPTLVLLRAQVEAGVSNFDKAKTFAQEALSLRSRYTEAISLLTQLDLRDGDVAGAIESARNILSLEPANPVRWYQLAVLFINQNDTGSAVAALEEAVRLDTNYANARYLLALQYAARGETDRAITELETVRSLSPNNEVVAGIIAGLRDGTISPDNAVVRAVDEPAPEGAVAPEGVTEEAVASDLISPVNTIPVTGEDTNFATTTPNASEQ